MKSVSVNIIDIINSDRFEPRFFYTKKSHETVFSTLAYDILNEIASLASGTTPEHSDEKINITDVCFLKSADIKRFSINYQTNSFIAKEKHLKQKRSSVHNNDILISNTGKYLGFTSVFTQVYEQANINQNSIRIRLNDNALYNPFFLTLYLNSKFGQEEIQSYLTITGQKYLNMQNFRLFRLPRFEKQFIDEITSKVKIIYEYEQQSIKLIEHAKLIYSNVLNISNSNVKTVSFSVHLQDFLSEDIWTPRFSNPLFVDIDKEISEKFPTVKLGDIATFQKGNEPGSDKYIGYEQSKDADTPFIRTTDLVNHECDMFPDFFIPVEYYNDINQDVKEYDILFTKDGKIGQTAMVCKGERAIIASGITRIRIKQKNDISPEYLFVVLSDNKTGYFPAYRRTVIGTTIPHLREEKMKDFIIPKIEISKISEITNLIKNAFELKYERKKVIQNIFKTINGIIYNQ